MLNRACGPAWPFTGRASSSNLHTSRSRNAEPAGPGGLRAVAESSHRAEADRLYLASAMADRRHGRGRFGALWGRATRRKLVQFLLSCVASLPLAPCQARAAGGGETEWDASFDDGLPVSTYKVIQRLNHDSKAFTQGLEFDSSGLLVESTGLYGESQLRRVQFDEGGKVVQKKAIPKKYFGEGLTIIDDYIVMLTWKERVAFVYDKESFAKRGSFPYPYEGWGLAKHRESGLLTTDGTHILRFWERIDPAAASTDAEPAAKTKGDKGKGSWWQETFSKPLQTADGREVSKVLWQLPNGKTMKLAVRLNELENVGGEIWANLWPTETIVRIDPESAAIKGWVDMRGLRQEAEELAEKKGRQIDVLNGIAYRPASELHPQALVVTGKWFPLAFQVEIVAPPSRGRAGGEGQAAAAAAGGAGSADDQGETTCAWKGFPLGTSRTAEVVAAAPSKMSAFQEIDFGM